MLPVIVVRWKVPAIPIAVCGTGLDSVYPRSSESLACEVEQRGVLISEFPIGAQARKFHFPLRNRIISGLSLGTFVVEAALHSGSLITAKQAVEYGREVFALPGSIHNPMAKGCHQLIRQGSQTGGFGGRHFERTRATSRLSAIPETSTCQRRQTR